MELRTVRRALAALAIAATLGLAGAAPAAAAETGWLERGLAWFSGLWAADDAAADAGAKVRPGGAIPLLVWASQAVERGLGMDPNGSNTPGSTPPPDGP